MLKGSETNMFSGLLQLFSRSVWILQTMGLEEILPFNRFIIITELLLKEQVLLRKLPLHNSTSCANCNLSKPCS